MDLRDFIIEFATRHNAQVPEAQEDGTYIFGVDQILLALQPIGVTGKFFISAKLADISSDNFEKLKNVLLQANFFTQGTDGSVFALDSTFSGVYLQKMIDATVLDFDQIEEILQSFLNTTDNWVALIDQVKTSISQDGTNNSAGGENQNLQDTQVSVNDVITNELKQSQQNAYNNSEPSPNGEFPWTSV